MSVYMHYLCMKLIQYNTALVTTVATDAQVFQHQGISKNSANHAHMAMWRG